MSPQAQRAQTRIGRRGSILIIAMWVLVALVGLVLVMSRSVRVESQGSRNRVAAIEAAAAERAGEQYVLSQIDQAAGDAVTAGAVQAESVPVGLAYFWVLRADREEDQQPDYGIDDEGSKLNINTASRDMLLKLPGMTAEAADSIIDWRDEDENPGENGAESSYYQALPRPYACKNAPFETTEELLLVKGVTPEMLYGYDANHNGLLDDVEAASGGLSGSVALDAGSGAASPRGLLPFITVYGVGTPTSTTSGTTGQTGTGGTGGTGGQTGTGGTGSTSGTSTLVNVNNQNPQPVLDLLRNALTTDRYNQVGPKVAQNRPYTSVLDFFIKTGLTPDEFAQVAGQLSTGGNPSAGLINVNTAPREVLRCLNGIEDAEAAALVSARQDADTSSIAWVAQALPQQKASAIGNQITGKTYRFSADVVGVSGDGRGYHRARIVVDASKTPAVVIYRRDLSGAGWPLPQEIRMMLRSGAGTSGTFGTGGLMAGGMR